MSGCFRASSENPTALSMARAGARLGPFVRGFGFHVMTRPRTDPAIGFRESSNSRKTLAFATSVQIRPGVPGHAHKANSLEQQPDPHKRDTPRGAPEQAAIRASSGRFHAVRTHS